MGNSELVKQLLPIVLLIVLAYIGKQLSGGSSSRGRSGGLAEVLGNILGGGGEKSLGNIFSSVLSGKGGALGDILGGLLGGKK